VGREVGAGWSEMDWTGHTFRLIWALRARQVAATLQMALWITDPVHPYKRLQWGSCDELWLNYAPQNRGCECNEDITTANRK
jgi:hypothetical protein